MNATHFLLLAVSIAMNFISCALLRNSFCKNDVRSNADLYLFNGVCSLISMAALAVIAAVGGSLGMPSLYTLLLGVVFGLATALCALLNMKALEKGPLSYTNVIISCSMVIPALSGMVLYGEAVSVWQWIGIALMIVSIVCAVDRENDTCGASPIWLLFCMGAFAANGSIGIMQKVHQSSPHKDELGAFLVIAFAVSGIFSLLLAQRFQKVQKQTVSVLGNLRRFAVFSVVSGIGIALCNQINMYLSGAMSAIIFFPVVNGAAMLLTSAAGLLIWKEKFSRRQWLGLVAGTIAILLLCNIL